MEESQVVSGNPKAGFRGEGITKYGRLVLIGRAALESKDQSRAIVWGVTPREAARVAPEGTSPSWNDPYIMDRRSWPGTEPPKEGIWQKGDGIINIDPEINVSTKAWRGWIFIKAGEPGEWVRSG